MDGKVTNVQKELDVLKTLVMENRPFKGSETILTLDNFSESHGFQFPIKSVEEFNDFDAKIVGDVYKDLVR